MNSQWWFEDMPWLTDQQRQQLRAAREQIQAAREECEELVTSKGPASIAAVLQGWQVDNAERYYEALVREMVDAAPLKHRLLFYAKEFLRWLTKNAS